MRTLVRWMSARIAAAQIASEIRAAKPAAPVRELEPFEERPHVPPGGRTWSFTLAAFWIALLCCLAIFVFGFLGPREVVLPDPPPTTFTVRSTRQQVRIVQGNPTVTVLEGVEGLFRG